MSEEAVVGVAGLGLVGGSIVRALPGSTLGWDADPAAREQARDAGVLVVDSLEPLVARCDLLFLAVPLPAMASVLYDVQLLRRDRGMVVTDVGSVKREVLAAYRSIGDPWFGFVPGHPMAGAERAGFAAGSTELFADAPWVLCPESDVAAPDYLRVAQAVGALGARVVPLSVDEHDAAVARVSHLPHLLAAALAVTAGEGGTAAVSLGAGSFRDGTRVAAAPAERSAAMCLRNRDALVAALRYADHVLAGAAGALEAGDGEALRRLFDSAAEVRRRYDEPPVAGGQVEVRLDDPGWRSTLLALGRSGAGITGVRRDGARVKLTTTALPHFEHDDPPG